MQGGMPALSKRPTGRVQGRGLTYHWAPGEGRGDLEFRGETKTELDQWHPDGNGLGPGTERPAHWMAWGGSTAERLGGSIADCGVMIRSAVWKTLCARGYGRRFVSGKKNPQAGLSPPPGEKY